MQDIFISPLNVSLLSWREAFAKATLADALPASPTKAQKTAHTVFWLHIHLNAQASAQAVKDGQAWLTCTIELIQKKYVNAKIAVLSNSPSQAEAFFAMSIGAVAYAHAYSPAPVLSEIKTVISHGGVWLGQDLLKRMIEVSTSLAGNQAAQVEQHLKALTKREKQVAIEAAKGLSNKEIARILNITERTVKAHLSSSFERLGAKDRLHLALMLNIKA